MQALSIIGDRRNKEAAEKKAKEKELLKVSIKKEDVDLIVRLSLDLLQVSVSLLSHLQMKEMEINRNLAERTLREHRGDVVQALITLTN